jgi:hypothetical protein
VTLTDENRFGLLGAGVLAVTSYSTRTAPTIRGKWLLENMPMRRRPRHRRMCQLEESNKDGTPRSVRDARAHR